MSARYAEDWFSAIDPLITLNHPQHMTCDPWWAEAGDIVCGCGTKLFCYESLRTRGEVL